MRDTVYEYSTPLKEALPAAGSGASVGAAGRLAALGATGESGLDENGCGSDGSVVRETEQDTAAQIKTTKVSRRR